MVVPTADGEVLPRRARVEPVRARGAVSGVLRPQLRHSRPRGSEKSRLRPERLREECRRERAGRVTDDEQSWAGMCSGSVERGQVGAAVGQGEKQLPVGGRIELQEEGDCPAHQQRRV